MATFEVPRAPPSALARHLSTLTTADSLEQRACAPLSDVSDSVMRSMHKAAERHRPSIQRLWQNVSETDRCETVDWLVQAFDVMRFSDGALAAAVLILDRYNASLSPNMQVTTNAMSQRNLLAAVCLALKFDSRLLTTLRMRQGKGLMEVVSHLGRHSIPFDDILDSELRMLVTLGFSVETPSSYQFLETLGLRLSRYGQRCRHLAEYLLELSYVDAPLCYRYAHSVLAAAAWALALRATEAPEQAFRMLVEDACVFSAQAVKDHLLACCADLRLLWVDTHRAPQAPYTTFVQHLRAKFGPAQGSVATIAPPADAVYPPLVTLVLAAGGATTARARHL